MDSPCLVFPSEFLTFSKQYVDFLKDIHVPGRLKACCLCMSSFIKTTGVNNRCVIYFAVVRLGNGAAIMLE